MRSIRILTFVCCFLVLICPAIAAPTGYYRQPALHGDTLVFVAEGDLWKVSVDGGMAARLTTHAEGEFEPAISPDGKTVAFTARYEGPREIYTMPLEGGLPTRRTFGPGPASVSGWTSDGRLLYSTTAFSTLPNWQLATLDVSRDDISGSSELVPLAQAADGLLRRRRADVVLHPAPVSGQPDQALQGRDGAEHLEDRRGRPGGRAADR